jgi:perosamine synthetase
MIPVNTPLLDGNEKDYLAQCIDSGWISSEGPFVTRFESEFSRRVGRRHGVAVSNGTAAIDAAIEALGIGPGDEVIVPAFTIISCVNQIVRAGAKAVLVDSDPGTWNMDVSRIESLVTPRTRAIMVVHVYGLPVDMDPVLDVARRYGLRVIEDAAEAHGQTYKGRPCGSFGDLSIFSFYPNKHVTTGEGGMVVTDDDALAQQCRDLRNLCFQPERRFVHDRLGWNLRMTNLQAAVGVAQLERLDEFVARKRRMGAFYTTMFSALGDVQLPQARTASADNVYWVYGLVLGERHGDASSVMRALAARGIGCRPFFFPLHQQPVLRRMGWYIDEHHPVAERLYRQGFYIPSGLGLSDDDMRQVAETVLEVLA